MVTSRTIKAKSPESQALRARREALGLSQEALAEASGILISQGAVSDLETGRVPLEKMELRRVRAYIQGLRWTLEDLERHTGVSLGRTTQSNDTQPKYPRYSGLYNAGLAKFMNVETVELRPINGLTITSDSKDIALAVVDADVFFDILFMQIDPGYLLVVDYSKLEGTPRLPHLYINRLTKKACVTKKSIKGDFVKIQPQNGDAAIIILPTDTSWEFVGCITTMHPGGA